MNTKHQVHNLIILDESGSMTSIKNMVIEGFQKLVDSIKEAKKQFPEQEHFISFVSFNGTKQKVLHFTEPVSKLKKINGKNYKPNSSTPLFDAMGFSINKLKNALKGVENYNVLVTIFTDGEENSSKEYSLDDIKKLIEELKQKRWTFTYIGTDHDVEKFASSVSITNKMHFVRTNTGIMDSFERERLARINYYRKIHEDKDTSSNYYDDDI